MDQIAAFASGFALAAGLIVAIGAQNVFVLRQGLRREHVGAVVAFCAAADAALMSAGVFGLGAALGAAPRLTLALTLAGAAYLAAFGVASLRRAAGAGGALAATAGGPGLDRRGALLRAAGFTFLNPHVYLDTVVLMGAVGAAQPADARLAYLAGACLASLAWFAALGFGARRLAPVFARPAAWRALDAAVAALMFALSVGLLLDAAPRLGF